MLAKNFLLVAAGGGIGAILRYGLSLILPNQSFPYATLTINLAGSFLLGIILALSVRNETLSSGFKLFLATGICGGFTTFSGFSSENLGLMQMGKYNIAFIYIITSVLGGLLATWLGFKLIQQ
jgi:CrcB protein